jgi:hypothetical protein
MSGRIPLWAEISREERFFTSLLFHDIRCNSAPMLRLLKEPLHLAPRTTISDVGFEVCLLRDAAFAGLTERHLPLEKQTFDLVLTFSDRRIAILEAKAQTGFHLKQISKLHKARDILAAADPRPFKEVEICAVTSSHYAPRTKVRKAFNAIWTWLEIATVYPRNAKHFERADSIYRDRARLKRLSP